MGHPVLYGISFLAAGKQSEWVPLKKSLKTHQDVWTALYFSGKVGWPDRVKICLLYNEGDVETLFEGSYAAALMWVLGIWDILKMNRRLELEGLLNKALCINSRGYQEESDGGKNNLEGSDRR